MIIEIHNFKGKVTEYSILPKLIDNFDLKNKNNQLNQLYEDYLLYCENERVNVPMSQPLFLEACKSLIPRFYMENTQIKSINNENGILKVDCTMKEAFYRRNFRTRHITYRS